MEALPMTKWPRNLELLRFSSNDPWTLDQATAGVLVVGATGSGKTSGPFNTIVRSFLRAGFGGIFLVAKADAVSEYIRLAQQENREKNIILFGPDSSNFRFNFLTYEAQQGAGKSIVHNIVTLLMDAIEVSQKHNNYSDQFFTDAMRVLLRHAVFTVLVATGTVDLGLVMEFVQGLPTNLTAVDEPDYFMSLRLLAQAEEKTSAEHLHDLRLAQRYVRFEWPALADRTRTSISATLTTALDSFLRYPLRDMFLGDLSVSPQAALDGKLIVVAVPIKEFGAIAQIAAVLWKASTQRAIERRPELKSGQRIETVRPVFIAADESQYFTSPLSDAQFQMTARASRGISLYSTQSISNFYAHGESGAARARIDSLLANFQTRIACNNLCSITNHWFSESIGKILIKRQSRSVVANGFLETLLAENGVINKPANISVSEQFDYDLNPRIFVGLGRGGAANKGIVEAIIVTAGDRFNANGKRWLLVRFNQFSEPQGLRRFISRDVLISLPRLKG